ncbi:MAG: hypothetical protein EHM47_07960 [Ignavibacteriales bacterium]|nr:MAG: hypothetical protein EHM47_07960 [Ignavibacteriales bacterium]
MFRLFVTSFLFSIIILFTSSAFAQDSDDFHVVHVQKWKLKSLPADNEADAFSQLLNKQSEVINSDSRVLNAYVLRHFWGADSRDLIMITEYKNTEDLFSLNEDFDSLMEKAYSKEELDNDNKLFDKYVGEHSDEIYRVVTSAKK